MTNNNKCIWAIVNKKGFYYNGNAYPMSDERKNWDSNYEKAFLYTKENAINKINFFPAMFSGCIAQAIL